MSAKIVLPSTPTWAQERLSAIYKAEGGDAFTSAFDAFIAKDVHSIVFNGETVSREEYKKHISDEKFFELSATVSFSATMEAPTPANVNAKKELVGLSYDATIFEKINVHGAPQARTAKSTIIIEVEHDHSIPVIPPPIHGDADTRRVFKLTQVLNIKVDNTKF
ncbi:hypothetical protein SCHPADRAFT_891400 [Schizopora paradoxa]|uniref:SnoaL-like domain-containing protein n=1 Tax=Schizopora paradoxa TaxID=27342 RepID=A0A0H2RJ34_9AGAM|nr:hypothetical protein SCHPADRAFT_891400 [Schizopora paradoxa]